ncbi:MAG: S8 family peptidase [candidate division WOR-3 bacterium]
MALVLIALTIAYARPDCPPVTDSDILNVLQREYALATVIAKTPEPKSGCPLSERVPGRYAVGFEPARQEVAVAWIAEKGGKVLRVDSVLGFAVAYFGDSLSPEEELSGEWRCLGLRYLEPDYQVWVTRIPNDPYFLTYQWDKYVMYADRAWDLATGGQVKLAIVDNGVDYLHPDLAANFDPANRGYDFVRGDNDPRPDNASVPEAFHGTHVAGIAAAAIDNSLGVAGWAQVQLLAVRCLNDSGQGNTTDVASGIRWAVDQGARVVNLSLGATYSPQPLTEACNYAVQQGALLVAASGNDGLGSINYPAALEACVAVGALSTDSRLASFSNYGHEQEVVAPGVDILSTGLNGTYLKADGTSMAAPQVAGVAALVLAHSPGLSLPRLRAILTAAAVDLGQLGRDNRYGYGLLNAWRALELSRRLESDGCSPAVTSERGQWLIVSRGRARTLAAAFDCPVEVLDCAGRTVATIGSGSGRDDNFLASLPSGVLYFRSGSGAGFRTGRILVIP